jgi:LuxR family maltose regulon positive regulatory protein
MSEPLLVTKFHIPAPGPWLLPRPGLVARLNEGLHLDRRLTLVSAPAGFGKTTLVAQWVRQLAATENPPRIAWLSLDSGEGDVARFLAYVIAALQRAGIDIQTGLLTAFQTPQPPPLESILTALVNELATISHPLLLVLDDAHLVQSPAVHRALNFMLDHLPPPIHVVIVTRADPPLKLAHRRGRGQLTEIRQSHLRFTPHEMDQFLRRATRALGVELSAGDRATLSARTEGWIAGLQMVATSLQGREDVPAFVRAFSGRDRHVMDYLIEEVFGQQPEKLQAFLVQTAILDRLSGPLCDALTGQTDGQQTLERLERANLFIVALDDERRWYRYHHLFADFLRQRLERLPADHETELHRRAAAWCSINRLPGAAIDHALAAGDFRQAASWVEQSAAAVWGRGEHATLLDWLDALPGGAVRARPVLATFHALVLFLSGRQHTAGQRLQAAEQSLAGAGATAGADLSRQRGTVATARAFVSFFEADLPAIVHASRQALAHLSGQDLTWRGLANYTLGLALRIQGDLAEAEAALSQARRLSRSAGMRYVSLLASLNLGIVQIHRGRLRQSVAIFGQALQVAQDWGLQHLPVAGLLQAELGNVLTEWNQLAEAERLIRAGIDLARQGQDVGSLGLGYTFLVRVLRAQGDLAGALRAAEAVERLAARTGLPPWVARGVTALKAEILVDRGELSAAAHLLEAPQPGRDDGPAHLAEIEHLALARLRVARGEWQPARTLLERMQASAESGGRVNALIKVLARLALVLQGQDDEQRAQRCLAQAFSLAQPEGYVRVFVDEGQPMARLLYAAASRGVAPAYAGALLAAFSERDLALVPPEDPARAASPAVEPLSERELQVLQLISQGLSNREIGQRLVISVNTVKSHCRAIYSKLDVGSRTQAVAKARGLELLPPL